MSIAIRKYSNTLIMIIIVFLARCGPRAFCLPLRAFPLEEKFGKQYISYRYSTIVCSTLMAVGRNVICSFAIILSLITTTRKSQTYDHRDRRRIALLFLPIGFNII